MDFDTIRIAAITAIFSDGTLSKGLVLKGGNALRLAYGIVERASLDLDFSLARDIDSDVLESRISRALENQFQLLGHRAFDLTLETRGTPADGGYLFQFKVIRSEKYEELALDLAGLRRNAQIIDSAQRRKFRIEISRGEFCPAVELSLGQTPIKVYSLELILIEKLRAICQQMPDGRPVGSSIVRTGRQRSLATSLAAWLGSTTTSKSSPGSLRA